MIFRLDGEILPSRREFAVGIRSDQDSDRQGRGRESQVRGRGEGRRGNGEANARDTRIDPAVERREKTVARSRPLSRYLSVDSR